MPSGAIDETFLAVRAGIKRSESEIYTLYRELRKAFPLWRSPWGDVYLSSWELVDRALASRDLSHELRRPSPSENGAHCVDAALSDWLIFREGASHFRLRRAMQGPLASGEADLSRRVSAIVEEHLHAIPRNRPFDAVESFTRAIPERVIAEIMGIPYGDMPQLRVWSEEIRTFLDTGLNGSCGPSSAAMDFIDYFDRTLRAGASCRSGIFDVSNVALAGGTRAAAANLAFMAFAGHETTVHLLASMLLHLALAPALLVSLRSTPALAPAVVSETLRLESPVQKICRWAVNDLELSREHRLHRGENAVLLVGAANRDPTRFENPDRMDLSRVQVPHLAFGKGVHACIGRGLAMMEGEAVLRWLIDNVDAIGLEEGAAEWIENSSFRGLKRLPITLRG